MSRAVRGDRHLMQGEDPLTEDPSDARTWIQVYEQLIGFKHRLLEQVNNEIARMPDALRPVVREDLAIIEEQLHVTRRDLRTGTTAISRSKAC